MDKKFLKLVPILILLALCVFFRNIYRVFSLYPNQQVSTNVYGADMQDYLSMAEDFRTGKTMQTEEGQYAKRVPGYPVFLSLFMGRGIEVKIIERSYRLDLKTLTYMQMILSCLTGIIVFFIGMTISGYSLGIVALLLCAIDPLFWIYPTYFISSEVLYTFLLSICMLFSVRFLKYGKIGDIIFQSIFLALSALVRPEAILLAPIFSSFYLSTVWRKKDWKPVIIFTTVFAFVVFPWIWRNYKIFHVPVWGTHGGLAFSIYNGSDARDTLLSDQERKNMESNRFVIGELATDRAYFKGRLRGLFSEPITGLKMFVHNALMTHYFMTFPDGSIFERKADSIFIFINIWVLLCLIFFCHRIPSVLFIFWGSFIFIYSLFAFCSRMRVSFEIPLILIAALGLTSFYREKKNFFIVLIVSLMFSVGSVWIYSEGLRKFIVDQVNQVFL